MVDDVVAIFFLSLLVALVLGGGGGVLAVGWVLAKILAFLGIAIAFGVWLLPRLTAVIDRLPISEGLMAWVFVIVLLYAWAAEELGGVAAITGSFLVGLLLARTPFRRSIEEGMHTLAYTWLVPIFFVSIGLGADARGMDLEDLLLAVVILVVAILSKVVGAGLGARAGGFSLREALQLGVGMVSRGEVGLIIATTEVDNGLIGDRIFVMAVLMVLVTALLTPIMLRALFPAPAVVPSER